MREFESALGGCLQASKGAGSKPGGGPLRVLLWSPSGAGLHYSGAGMNAFRIYSQLDPSEVVVDLVHGSGRQAEAGPFRRQFYLSNLGRHGPFEVARFLERSYRWLRRNAARYDVFHGINIFEPTFEPANWARRLGVATFVSPQNFGCGFAPSQGLRRFLRLPQRRLRLAASMEGVIAISREIREELLGYGLPEKKVRYIPNGVDCRRFRPVSADERRAQRSSLGWEEDAVVMLFVGGLCARKRPDWLIRIAEMVARKGRRLQLAFVGPELEVGLESSLRRLGERSGERLAMNFYGHTEQVELFYRAADLFCLPSLNEGMSVAMLEALASGLPTLTCPVSGAADVIEDGESGFLVETPDEAAVCIWALLESPDLMARVKQGGRRRAELFSLESTWRMHRDLFHEAAAARGGDSCGKWKDAS